MKGERDKKYDGTVEKVYSSKYHFQCMSSTVMHVTHEDLSSLNSCAKPVAHCRQSVGEGPVQPSQVGEHRKQKRLAG